MSRARKRRRAEEARRRVLEAVEQRLGGRPICDRCGATIQTYAEVCTADIDLRCPGFEAIEEAIAHG